VSDAEKPFEATPQRLEKARREGNVARSAELGANVAFAAAALSVAALAPLFGTLGSGAIVRAAASVAPAYDFLALVAIGLLPVGSAALAGAAVAALQNGGLTFAALTLKPERLNPIEGCKRMASRETLMHGLRALAAFVLAAAAIVPLVRAALTSSVASGSLDGVVAAVWSAVLKVSAAACIVGTAFAVGEYAAARRAWLQKLRMSFDDRKRESKEQEGDPIDRRRRRALHRSLVRGAVADVAKASFVVANPTHVAVALRYAPPAVSIPTILVRAGGDAAARVRAIARDCGIPVVENVSLARALYRDGRVGDPIDRTFFVAIAEVVAALSRAGLLNR
jgi:flagellar biosynthetic protein FlhB